MLLAFSCAPAVCHLYSPTLGRALEFTCSRGELTCSRGVLTWVTAKFSENGFWGYSGGMEGEGGSPFKRKEKNHQAAKQRCYCNTGISVSAKLPSYLRPHRPAMLNFSPSADNLLLPIGSGPTTHLAAQPETEGGVLPSQPLVLTPHRQDRVSASSCVSARSLQSYWTLRDPTDCRLLGFSVHGSLQAQILAGVAISSSRRSSQPRDRTCISYDSCLGRWVLYPKCYLGSSKLVHWSLIILFYWTNFILFYWINLILLYWILS